MKTERPDQKQHIEYLSPLLASQIAAGEVIERPASIIKELLENSLDAGAGKIEVDIEEGGLTSIRVRDNGGGIYKEDLPLALASHATSKLKSAEQLSAIMSLGFRGEAVASIASVSRLSITSRQFENEQAWKIQANSDNVTEPASHPPGTTISVYDLFYNVPVRRKFLRSAKTEFLHIQEQIRRMALSHFETEFRLKHNQRSSLYFKSQPAGLPGAARISAVCGDAFLERALPFDNTQAGIRVWGWLGLPDYSRSRADVQYSYLNGRSIRDRLINHALRQAYAEHVQEGRYPAWVIYIEVDASAVDVNVHPTKHEVRFRDPRTAHDSVYYILKQTLEGNTLADSQPPVQNRHNTSGYNARKSNSSTVKIKQQLSAYAKLSPRHDQPQDLSAITKCLAIIEKRYLLLEKEGQIAIVDLKQAVYALCKIELNHIVNQQLTVMPLMFPKNVNTPQNAESYLKLEPVLKQLGIVFSVNGPDSLSLREIPESLKNLDEYIIESIFSRILNNEAMLNDIPALVDLFATYALVPELTLTSYARFVEKLDNENLLSRVDIFRKISAADLTLLFK